MSNQKTLPPRALQPGPMSTVPFVTRLKARRHSSIRPEWPTGAPGPPAERTSGVIATGQ